jgi:exodeoxyribonuclease-3
MKIATWNVNSITGRIKGVIDWTVKNQPDVLCLQETKCVDEKFPYRKFNAAGYPHIAHHGEKAYNGVALISKYPIIGLQKGFPDEDPDAARRLIGGTINGIRIVSVYVPHGTRIGTDKFTAKIEWLERLRRYFDEEFDVEDDVLLCGDLNIAPREIDVWKISIWKNKLHFTKPERDTLLHLKKWGFIDLFRHINDDERAFSWWDYFHPHSVDWDKGLRLDHIWTSEPLAERCRDCWIDKEPRSLERPSDHAPVVAEFIM